MLIPDFFPSSNEYLHDYDDPISHCCGLGCLCGDDLVCGNIFGALVTSIRQWTFIYRDGLRQLSIWSICSITILIELFMICTLRSPCPVSPLSVADSCQIFFPANFPPRDNYLDSGAIKQEATRAFLRTERRRLHDRTGYERLPLRRTSMRPRHYSSRRLCCLSSQQLSRRDRGGRRQHRERMAAMKTL